jgi:hypothetical protein
MNSHSGSENDSRGRSSQQRATLAASSAASIERVRHIFEAKEAKQAVLESDVMTQLQDAIGDLAPEDVATVKALLDSKVAEGNGNSSSYHSAQWQQPRHSAYNSDGTRPWNQDGESWRGPARPPRTVARPPPGVRMSDYERKELENPGDSLRDNLLALASIDQSRVVMIRKINRIGLNSPNVLEAHYSNFGGIERVMVSHCLQNRTGFKRLRPAALGFLVMDKAEDAKAIMDAGEIQTVQGVEVSVGPFESHSV